MIGNIAGVKKVDFPYQLINSVADVKPAKVSDAVIKGIRKYYSNKEYRNRIGNLYENLNKIRPTDTINHVLYTDNYTERGVAIKSNVSSLKQMWTEYRLLFNEKEEKKEVESTMGRETFNPNLDLFHLDPTPSYNFDNEPINDDIKNYNELPTINEETPSFINPSLNIDTNNYINTDSYVLNNFDEIFDRLSKRVDGVNHYIADLKQKKDEINNDTTLLEMNRQQLEQEKKAFENYKTEETKKIEQEKETLKANFERFQTLVDSIDSKLNDVMN